MYVFVLHVFVFHWFFFLVKKLVKIEKDAYSALENAHALVVCTEWDEFKVRCFPYHFHQRFTFQMLNFLYNIFNISYLLFAPRHNLLILPFRLWIIAVFMLIC